MAGLMNAPKQENRKVPFNTTAKALPSGSVEASPEEQQVYGQFVAKAMELIYSEKIMPRLLDMMSNGDPKTGMANAGAFIVKRVMDAAAKAGRKIPGEVVLNAGEELVELLEELRQAAGLPEMSPNELEGAYLIAADQVREMMMGDGSLDVDVMKRDFQQLVEAENSGKIGELLGLDGGVA